MAYYVKGDEPECCICGNEIDECEALVCPVCNQVVCIDCAEQEGVRWCPECDAPLQDLETYLEELEEDEEE